MKKNIVKIDDLLIKNKELLKKMKDPANVDNVELI